MKKDYFELLNKAKKAMKKSYSPYSGFKVGAAVLTGRGKIFTGTNVENASFGLTVCAERVALCKAVSEGERKIKAMAVVSGGKESAYPCGACLQVLSEFGKDADILIAKKQGKCEILKLGELLPVSFRLKK